MNTSNMKRAKPLHQFYTDKVAALTAEIAELKRHNTTFVLAELAAFRGYDYMPRGLYLDKHRCPVYHSRRDFLCRLLLHPTGGCRE